MAKLYRITLSSGDEGAVIVPESDPPVSLRGCETEMLLGLLKAAIRSEKDIEKINEAVDVIGQIRNIEGDTISLTASDLKTIRQGISGSAGMRPMLWCECVSLWAQLKEPEEVVV